ncbi:TfoX/Sxy family protein [Dietzia sp. ANT_WB102]|uniref:TfoX/Sxy family protein n=1 Tax=Dietzia sp. ANT_WB102 TaxID=2597345 RepID=UPI0011EE3A99|nr:TfoX/Sxy family protein [Dietzia sp. ANT_WB102]KAA0919711.1 TfoX/Sxy family protein [Dietzia sp. ANT_WB102]
MARTPTPPAQQRLIDRLRDHLADETVTREVSMFGGHCFMVAGKILVSAGRDGGILLRVAAEHEGELLRRPGATRAEMGAGRTMGPGWISVSAVALDSDAGLSEWLAPALEYNHGVVGRTE